MLRSALIAFSLLGINNLYAAETAAATPALTPTQQELFAKATQVLEYNCLKCHCDDVGSDNLPNFTKAGNLNMVSRKELLKGGKRGPGFIEKAGLGSLIVLFTDPSMPRGERAPDFSLPPDKLGMPPLQSPFRALIPAERQALIDWIDAGAPWPAGHKLKAKTPPRPRILATKLYLDLGFDKLAQAPELKCYEETLKDTDLKFSMIAIPGGTFKRGDDTLDDAKPVRDIEISPFFMSSTEVTWDLYNAFMESKDAENRAKASGTASTETLNDRLAYLVARPTPPYHEMSFGMGKDGFPAICMTRLSAQAFCLWLSAKTGHFYRLPTEAEWEYACRAGSTTKYPWGDELADAEAYVIHAGNANEKYAKVGSKKPNAWGLYDMLGNAAEYTLDHYDPAFYAASSAKNPFLPMPADNASNPAVEKAWPFKIYDQVLRGGGFVQDIEDISPAHRYVTTPEMKNQDPQMPKSPWWFTERDFMIPGIRLVRMPTPPKLEDLHLYWPTDEELRIAPLAKDETLDEKYIVK